MKNELERADDVQNSVISRLAAGQFWSLSGQSVCVCVWSAMESMESYIAAYYTGFHGSATVVHMLQCSGETSGRNVQG